MKARVKETNQIIDVREIKDWKTGDIVSYWSDDTEKDYWIFDLDFENITPGVNEPIDSEQNRCNMAKDIMLARPNLSIAECVKLADELINELKKTSK